MSFFLIKRTTVEFAGVKACFSSFLCLGFANAVGCLLEGSGWSWIVEFFFWLLLNVFVCASFLGGCVLGFVFDLLCGLGLFGCSCGCDGAFSMLVVAVFRLLVDFFNMVVAPKPIGFGKETHGWSNESQKTAKTPTCLVISASTCPNPQQHALY